MLLWDIPVGIMSDGMGDPIMHLHHVGFFVVATIALGVFSHGVPVGSAYAPFFFGVIELSSIPLVIVDGTYVHACVCVCVCIHIYRLRFVCFVKQHY